MSYQYDFRLKKLTSENFRGFEKIELDFNEQLTILIGANGSGKSSVLDLLQEIFRHTVKGLFGTRTYHPKFNLDDNSIRYNQQKSNNELLIDLDYVVWNEENELEKEQDTISLDYNLTKGQGENLNITVVEEDKDKNEWSSSTKIKDTFTNLQQEEAVFSLPILSYYAMGEIASKSENTYPFESHQLSIYNDLGTKESVNFKNLKLWLEWQQKRDNQRKLKGLATENAQLIENIYQDILALLNDDEQVYEQIEISWENIQEGEIVIYKQGTPLSENQLSSGEKVLFALVADISAKLALANPTIDNPSREGKGVVLIDEIDLHLHPKWQRKIINKLLEIFPKVQFVVSTHSPALVGAVDKKHVRILKNNQVYLSTYTKGRDLNAINTDIFDVPKRTPEYEEKISKFYSLLESNVEEAQKLLNELKQDFGEHDEEIVRAESYIEIY